MELASTDSQGGAEERTFHIALHGDLNMTRVDELRHMLLAGEHADVAVLDFADVGYIDSTALTALVLLRHRMTKNGGKGVLKIARPNKSVRRLLAICRLDHVFEVLD